MDALIGISKKDSIGQWMLKIDYLNVAYAWKYSYEKAVIANPRMDIYRLKDSPSYLLNQWDGVFR